MKKMLRVVRKLVVASAFGYALVLVLIAIQQESLLFADRSLPSDYDFKLPPSAQEFWIDRPDGARLHGLRYGTGGQAGIVLYFHGNAANNGNLGGMVQIYGPLDYDVIGIDYRGYGKSIGDRSEAVLLADALAFYDTTIAEGTPPPVLVGRSLGTVFATYVAAHRPTRHLVLYSPAASIAHVAGLHYPYLPIFILRYPLRTDEFIQHVKAPILAFHGTDDAVIPIESGELLREYFKPTDLFIPIPGGTHRDIPWRSDVIHMLTKVLDTQ